MGRLRERGVSAAEMMGFPAGESKEWLFAPEVKVAQSCLTLYDPMNYAVHGILQARILEWVAIPFSRGIFPTQGWNLVLPHCRWIFLQAEPQGKPKTH